MNFSAEPRSAESAHRAGRRQGQRAVSLLELLFVLVIVGILLTLALPAYSEYTLRARRAVAVSQLHMLLAQQERFFLAHRRYAASLDLLGLADPHFVSASGAPTTAQAMDRVYRIEFSQTGATVFILSATPLLSQAADVRCAVISVSSDGTLAVTGEAVAVDCFNGKSGYR